MAELKNINALIVAAGASSRCKGYKPLYRWKNKSLIEHIVRKLANVAEQLIVVTGHNAELLESTLTAACSYDVLSKITFVHNAAHRKGMFSSLQAGCSALTGDSWVLYHFVDQPALPEQFFTEFIEQIDESSDWIQPVFSGKKGHPILLSPKTQKYIGYASHLSTLKDVGENRQIVKKLWDCPYPEILQDIDTDEDWAEFLHFNE